MEQLIKKLISFIRAFINNKLHYDSDELPFYLSIFISAVLFITGINLFLELAEELAENDLEKFDTAISEYIISFRSEQITNIFKFITSLGDYLSYIILTAAISIFFLLKQKSWKFILQIAGVSILSFLINLAMKEYYGRERPSAEQLVEVSYLSFPSGHAMSAAAFYGFIIYLVLRYIKSNTLKIFITAICSLIILFIGMSRVYLGVHYPSDVIAGFLGGFFWVTFCIIIFNVLGLVRKRKLR